MFPEWEPMGKKMENFVENRWMNKYVAISIATAVFLLATWYVSTAFFSISKLVIPSPGELIRKVRELFSQGYVGTPMYEHIMRSLVRTSIGLLTAIVLGIPLGLWAGYSRTFSAVLTPITSFLRPIPPIAYIPLVILWFGIGEFSKISLVFMGAFLYMILNCSAGVRSVPNEMILVATNLGASKKQLFTTVILPASLPFVITGIKTATAMSWSVIVAAELVAAQQGLGYMIMDAATFFRIPEVYIGIIIVGLIGFTLEAIVSNIDNKFCHWAGK